MKKFLFLLAFGPSFLFAQEKGFVINGKVDGLPNGVVQITSTQEDHQVVATGIAENGAFTIKGAIPEPGLYFLVLNKTDQPQYVFLENTNITISGSEKDIKNLKIEGSKSNDDFKEFNTIFNPMVAQLNALAMQIQKEENDKKRDDLIKQYNTVASNVSDEVGKFVASKRSSYVSPFLLWVTAPVSNDPLLMEQRFNMLDENVRNSQIGKALAQNIEYSKVGAVGTNALDFTQTDVTGKPVSLSSFKGKYVLVDFWASWCKPCRAENPNVVKVFNKFKEKNFTILSVSLDQKKEDWIKAIQNDHLSWNNVSDLQQWNNAVAVMYHINSIPGNFLVDPNGKIIAKDLRGEDLEKKLCEVLGGCNAPKP